MTPNAMTTVSAGLSEECIKGLVAEGLAYSSLFIATTTVAAGLAVAGLFVAPVLLAIACKNG